MIGHKSRVWQADWHPNGHFILSCGADKTIKQVSYDHLEACLFCDTVMYANLALVFRLWNVESSRVYNTDASNIAVDGCTSIPCLRSIETPEHKRSIRSIAFSPLLKDAPWLLFATCSFDGKTVIWESALEYDVQLKKQSSKVSEGHLFPPSQACRFERTSGRRQPNVLVIPCLVFCILHLTHHSLPRPFRTGYLQQHSKVMKMKSNVSLGHDTTIAQTRFFSLHVVETRAFGFGKASEPKQHETRNASTKNEEWLTDFIDLM